MPSRSACGSIRATPISRCSTQGLAEGAPLVGLPLVFALCYDAGLDAVSAARGADARDAFRRLLPRLDASIGEPLLKRASGF